MKKYKTTAVAMLIPAMAMAADAASVISTVTSQLRSAMTLLFDLVGVLLSIICGVGLLVAIGKWVFVDHDSTKALLQWGSGFLIGIILLGIVKLTA